MSDGDAFKVDRRAFFGLAAAAPIVGPKLVKDALEKPRFRPLAFGRIFTTEDWVLPGQFRGHVNAAAFGGLESLQSAEEKIVAVCKSCQAATDRFELALSQIEIPNRLFGATINEYGEAV